MYGHPIVKELESWWAAHGGKDPNDSAWIAFIQDFSAIMLTKYEEWATEHSNAGRFGMSRAAGCTRAAGLKFLGHEADLSGSSHATFMIGHLVEVMAIATLRASGYVVHYVDDNLRQFRASIDPFMDSAHDARMILDGEPALLSVKSIGYKMSGSKWVKNEGKVWTRHGFAELPLKGVRDSAPATWAQSQTEMHASGIHRSLTVYVAKDMVKKMDGDPLMQQNGSLTFYAELLGYDEAFCSNQLTPTWARQWDAVQRGVAGDAMALGKSGVYVELNPSDPKGNMARTGKGYNDCDYCDLREACVSDRLTSQLTASIAIAEART